MATIKAFTDLQQSKKLAEFLPLESADMWWLYITAQGKHIAMMYEEPDPHYIARMESYGIKDCAVRCWSLAALLNVLPNDFYATTTLSKGDFDVDLMKYKNEWVCDFEPELGSNYHTTSADNPVDACVAMIEKLHEQKLL